MREVRTSGHAGLELATALLQRMRLADPLAGCWEASDVQWWWRRPRPSDDLEQAFWVDDDGPVAGVWLTSWGERWQCDPLLVPGVTSPSVEDVWGRALEQIRTHADGTVEVPVSGHDPALQALVEAAGLAADEQFSTGWLDAAARPAVRPLPDGYRLVDRVVRRGTPHPMRLRSGPAVAERLAECSLYDPWLDLAVEASDGSTAAYALFWADPVTGVGETEPVRVEDDHQRRGLATALVTEGLARLAARGATRLTIGWESPEAESIYTGLGFERTSLDTTYVGLATDLRS